MSEQKSRDRVLFVVVLVTTVVLVHCGCSEKIDISDQKKKETNNASRNNDPIKQKRIKQERAGTKLSAEKRFETDHSSNPQYKKQDVPEQSKEQVVVKPVYRPSDTRPRHNDKVLEQAGIHVYESKRLKLYSDIETEKAQTLPGDVDQAYQAWEKYFGPMPPDREGTEYQMTGYLMIDKELFRKAGLLPDDLPPFLHGRHVGAEFWMNDQKDNYYRRHLVLHEATHCFMTSIRDTRIAPWYLEGMAELFGTHWRDSKGNTSFGVMPHNKTDFQGLGRITMLQVRTGEGKFVSLSDVVGLDADAYLQNDAYAWSWALCQFLNNHPRYKKQFRALGNHLTPSTFETGFLSVFQDDFINMKTEWCLFAHNLQDGFDVERSAIEFIQGKKLLPGQTTDPIVISANRSWQSSKVRVVQGKNYEVIATGRFTLAQKPKPWISEPQGVSIRYYQGRPLGMLLGSIRDETEGGIRNAGTQSESMLTIVPIGQKQQFRSEFTGTLYFRLNDSFSELDDNEGNVNITIREVQP